MNDTSRGSEGSLPISQYEAIVETCDAFESAWLAGRRPDIRAHVERMAPAWHGFAFRALLELDLEYRCQRGEHVVTEEYVGAFPEFRAEIDDVFRRHETADAPTQPDALLPIPAPGKVVTDSVSAATTVPIVRIGRFRIIREIASGTFGTVYQGLDEVLERYVAIKIARHYRSPGPADFQLLEARIAANLDHPCIVPVYEVGRLDDRRLYLVSKFINGTDLKSRLKEFTYATDDAVRLIIDVGEALHSAHLRGVFHRDIKPANILIDEHHQPYLADFGLALRVEQAGEGAEFVGTVPYMSPEQARREGHLVDARSDVFSLSAVLYELVTGRQPFRGETSEDVLRQIQTASPVPPCQINAQLPAALERIVLKGLARRAADRYASAQALVNDLRYFLADKTSAIEDQGPAAVVPKGLRAFDQGDAAFFLRLIPGPRTREGLPESLDFWKSRIEAREMARTFRVGVLYGPSGSGKSSLVHAGLLPHLHASVITCCISASPDNTEQHWLRELRRQFPALAGEDVLTDAMRALRSGRRVSRESKVLIVIDQFEQWLSAHSHFEASELVSALRQCDGAHIQVLLLVRDDYWTSLVTCLQGVDVELDSSNSRLLQWFDAQHAKTVLFEFGQAYGQIDNHSASFGARQEFVDQVVRQMAAEGAIAPVRLAVFAEMFRARPWTTRELRRVKGVDGVVSLSLDRMVDGDGPHEGIRRQADATIRLLSALLPPAGSRIKGRPKTCDELIVESRSDAGVASATRILQLLDTEYRLIISLEPDQGERGDKRYQLAHEYLVPIVREWIARRRRDTFSGRAENLLNDRTAIWTQSPTHRNLPSALEWLLVRSLVDPAHWSKPARRMMNWADRWYASWIAGLGVFLLAVIMIGHHVVRWNAAVSLRDQLRAATTARVPALVERVRKSPQYAIPLLRREFAALKPDADDDSSFRRRLHLALALVSADSSQLEFLVDEGITRVAPEEVELVASLLAVHKENATRRLRAAVERTGDDEGATTLRQASALALLAPDDPCWERLADRVSRALVSAPPLRLSIWKKQLGPVEERLKRPMLGLFLADLSAVERTQLEDLVLEYASHDPAYRRYAAEELAAQFSRLIQSESADSMAAMEPLPEAIRSQIEDHGGLVTDRAAFVQTLPLAAAEPMMTIMHSSGYRPVSFRPFAAEAGLMAAIGWTRDGLEAKTEYHLAPQELAAAFRENRSKRMGLADFSWYSNDDVSTNNVRFAATWVAVEPSHPSTELFIDQTAADYRAQKADLQRESFFPARVLARVGRDGEPLYSSIWQRHGVKTSHSLHPFVAFLKDAEKPYYKGYLHTDCQLFCLDLSKKDIQDATGHVASLQHKRALDEIEKRNLAISYFQLGEFEMSLELFSQLTAEAPAFFPYGDFRVKALAALGRVDEANEEIARFETAGGTPEELRIMKLRAALASENAEAALAHLENLEQLLSVASRSEQSNGDTSAAPPNKPAKKIARLTAMANAVLARYFLPRDPNEAHRFQQRALQLLQEHPELHTVSLLRDDDYDALRPLPDFQRMLHEQNWDVRYVVSWMHSDGTRSQLYLGMTPDVHREKCRKLLDEGYYPRAISARFLPTAKNVVTASVWHQPVVETIAQQARRSRDLAQLMIPLAHLGRLELLETVAQKPELRETRSLVIEGLGTSRVLSPESIRKLLDNQSTCRDALLVLGMHRSKDFPSADFARTSQVVRSLATGTDSASVRSAAVWCLSQWNLPLENGAAGEPAVKNPARDWYVNPIGQTMIRLKPPERVFIGSPSWEKDHAQNEIQQLHSLGRSYWLSATETTIAQFQQFLASPEAAAYYGYELPTYSTTYAPFPACPQISATYYDVRRFCEWLSANERIPADQHCYPGAWKDDHELPNDFSSRTGYRLPTEAEWEFACRAGSPASRHFGDAEELLPYYAWGLANSNGRSRPVGALMPNEFGFFDMLGNVKEWCHDEYRRFAESISSGTTDRTVRGGDFTSLDRHLRSAVRSHSDPDMPNYTIGFRVARTGP